MQMQQDNNRKKANNVVIKVDMHCQACARKVNKVARDFPGVQDTAVDMQDNRLTVMPAANHKLDAQGLCQVLQKKMGKKVQQISPPPPKNAENDNKSNKQDKDKDKLITKAKEPPAVATTTVLKMFLHCPGCARSVRNAILRFKEVQSVEPDTRNHTVTVKSTMDPVKLVEYLRSKTRKHVEILQQEKKQKNGNGNGNGNGNSRADNKKDNGNNKNQIPPLYSMMEQVHPPFIFSDDNPEACSLM